MKYFKYILTITCCVCIISACDSVDFGSVNEDDDSLTQANTKSLLSTAMNSYFNQQMIAPALYVQYQSQIQYTSEQRYSVSPTNWSTYYVNILSNLQQVVETNSEETIDELTRTYGAPVNQIGVSELMSVMVWKRVTDSWGPVPYNNALSDSTITPTYTDQETIYRDLIERAKDARDMLDPSLDGPQGDVVYGGDVTQWQKFANSLLLTMSIQLSNQYPDAGGYAATEFNAALNDPAGVIETIDDEFWYQYQNISSATNPYSDLRGADYQASLPLTSALNGEADGSFITYSSDEKDDRLNVYVADPSLDGRPYGRATLSDDNTPAGLTDSYTAMSSAILSPDSPLPFMTAAYTYLNRAEAAERGWTSEDAGSMLETGIEMSFSTIDAHWDDGAAASGNLQSDGSDYASSRMDDADMMQVIAEEKWAALYPMGYMAWSEWRRTGVPGLIPAVDAVNDGNIPTRYIYPDSEDGTNRANYRSALELLSPSEDSNTSLFWWDM